MGLYDFFSRVLVPVRQRPSSTDLNRLQTYLEQNDRWIQTLYGGVTIAGDATQTESLATGFTYPPHGFLGGGFKVGSTGGMGVAVSAGVGFSRSGPVTAADIDSASGADLVASTSLSFPLALSAVEPLTVPAVPAAGSSRIDLIEIRADYLAGSPATVGILNTATRVFDPTVKNKRLHWDLTGRTGSVNAPAVSTAPISYVRGVAAVGGITAATEPTLTSGYVRLARINLDNSGGALAAVTQDMIADLRPHVWPGGVMRVAGRITLPGVVGGIADPLLAINTVELPPGVILRAGFTNNVPPSVGRSYQVTCYLIGGDLYPATVPSSQLRGVVTSQPGSLLRLGVVTPPILSRVDAATRSRIAGTDATWSPLGGHISTVAIGQKVVSFNLEVDHSDGVSAVGTVESISFDFTLGQG